MPHVRRGGEDGELEGLGGFKRTELLGGVGRGRHDVALGRVLGERPGAEVRGARFFQTNRRRTKRGALRDRDADPAAGFSRDGTRRHRREHRRVGSVGRHVAASARGASSFGLLAPLAHRDDTHRSGWRENSGRTHVTSTGRRRDGWRLLSHVARGPPSRHSRTRRPDAKRHGINLRSFQPPRLELLEPRPATHLRDADRARHKGKLTCAPRGSREEKHTKARTKARGDGGHDDGLRQG